MNNTLVSFETEAVREIYSLGLSRLGGDRAESRSRIYSTGRTELKSQRLVLRNIAIW